MNSISPATKPPSVGATVVSAACAGGLGWGIRGQYGHETGAMIAGVLVGLAVVWHFRTVLTSLTGARTVAMTAIGISFGGSMTYGQTVGLTHDAELIGNSSAYWWGMLGLFVKGGVWIGFAGGFMGMALSRQNYRPIEVVLLLIAITGMLLIGVRLVNQPFVPEQRLLPRIYFSDHWYWEPNKADLKPRFERWGGLALALATLLVYVRCVRKDQLALRLALCGFLAGGVGFSGGQSVQAFHAWHPDLVQTWMPDGVYSLMNWWNFMEMSFGFILGGGLAYGVWLNRGLLRNDHGDSVLPIWGDILLALLYVAIIVCWNFFSIPQLDQFADLAVPVGVLPVLGVVGGRFFPYLMSFPLVCVPIAGKTLRYLVSQEQSAVGINDWPWVVLCPLVLMSATAVYLFRRGCGDATRFARVGLLVVVATYFGLNFAFFDFPWPWSPATGRTPSAWMMTIFSLVILGFVANAPRKS